MALLFLNRTMVTQDWNIQAPASSCSITNQLFNDGDVFYSILHQQNNLIVRQDFSESAWLDLSDQFQPLCFWKTMFKAPAPRAEEPLKKTDAESLLRQFLKQEDPRKQNVCYILALMLERKRLLKQIETLRKDQITYLVYEHVKTGETFIVADPHLRLAELTAVQEEVVQLLTQST